jgi:hypothetical protein
MGWDRNGIAMAGKSTGAKKRDGVQDAKHALDALIKSMEILRLWVLVWVPCPSIASTKIQGSHHRCRFVIRRIDRAETARR